jgi:hypothetical protein
MSKPSRMVALVVSGLLTGGVALAQTPDDGGERGWRPVLAAGVTVGGDTIAKFQMSDGSTQTLSGGGLVHLYGGLRRQFGLWAVQGSFGYQVDDVTGRDGSAQFERFPLEALAQYRASDVVLIGAGLRKVTGARLSSSGAVTAMGFPSSVALTVGPGLFVEGDYVLSPKAQFSVKLVSETYKDPWGGSFKGDHIGFYIKGLL